MNEELFFELLQQQFDEVLPWVAYRKPNEGVVNAFLQDDDTIYEVGDFTESGFVFAPFDNSKTRTLLIPSKNSQTISFQQDHRGQEETDSYVESKAHSLTQDASHKVRHIALVDKGLQQLKDGALQKVVLSRKQKMSIVEKSPVVILKKLLAAYSTAFVYCWYHPKIGLWLGATPETLLSVDHRKLKTMSLAGTQQYLGTLDVKWGVKEIEEQQLVTDSIVRNLKPIVGDLNISPVETHKAGSLLHLKTNIEVDFNKTDQCLSRILSALHPTPAVCGLPKENAKKFIIANENYDRGYYTGFLGELNLTKQKQRSSSRRNVENLAYRLVTKHSDLYVNLRCMEIDASGAQLYVGGGITQASTPESEWEETVNKLETMAAVLKEKS